MRIGIEGQRLFRPAKHGMDTVALELIRNLQEIDGENEYFIFVKPDKDDGVLRETRNFHIVRLEGKSYPYWEQIALPRAARETGCEILHCTSNTAPVNTSIPLIITLHDIIYMEHSYLDILRGSGTPYQKSGNIYRKIVVPNVVRKSRKIITVSEYEKKRIRDFFRIYGDSRLISVYNGVSPHFRPVRDPEELTMVRKKYNLPEKFFCFLGNTDPKKNTPGVVRAFAEYARKNGRDIPLVMIDFRRPDLDRILEELDEWELSGQIILPGYISNTDLPAIFSQSTVFLYPSLRESFGIPVLEAMACGTPVITSTTSSMPEVAGSAALLVDPYHSEKIAEAMEQLVRDDSLRKTLVEKGLQRAAEFSWRSMAEKVLDIYYETGLKKNRENHIQKAK